MNKERKPVIGIVGGIGAGKTAVAREFERQGCLMISADEQNDAILRESAVIETLVSWWGVGIKKSNGALDRKKIGEIVFSDPQQRARLESLTHPLIAARRAAIIQQGIDEPAVVAIVLDSPLLFERNLDTQCDRIVFVEARRDIRLERLRNGRGWTDTDLDRRETAQMPLPEKKKRCDFVIRNEGSPDEIPPQVRGVLDRVIREFSANERKLD